MRRIVIMAAVGIGFFRALSAYADIGLTLAGGGSYLDSEAKAFGEASADGGGRFRLGDAGYLELSAGGAARYYGPSEDFAATGSAMVRLGRLFGLNAAALRLAASGLTGYPDAEDSAALEASIPLTFNGTSASLSLEPGAVWDPLPTGYAGAYLRGFASFQAGDSVLKPGFALSYTRYRDGLDILGISPSAGVSWYPGIPATAGLSLSVSRDSDLANGSTTWYGSAGVNASVSVSSALLLSGDVTAGLSEEGPWTETALGLETFFPGEGKNRLSIPVKARILTGGDFGFEVTAGLKVER